jgi:iron complex outermembrane receptor protein
LGAGNAVIGLIIPRFSLVAVLCGAALAGFARADGMGAAGAPPDSVADRPPAAAAVARLDSITLLPEVVVEGQLATRARQRRPTAFATVLRVDGSVRSYESVGQLLEQAAGVHIVRHGGLGAFSTVSLRGAPPGQVAVYVDGVPMQSAAQTVVNLAELPMSAIQAIEVYRGGAPLALGPGRPGGAIHLTTAITGGASARVARGSFDTWDASGRVGATLGALSARLHGGYQGSDGDYAYRNDNGTPFNTADDAEATRRNNRFDMTHGGALVAWQPDPRWRVQAAGTLQRQAQGFPGLGNVPAPNARSRLSRGSGQLSLTRSLEGDGRIEAAAILQRDRRRFEDAEGRLGLGRHRTDDRLASEQAALRTLLPRRLGVQLEGGLSLRLEHAELADALDGRPDPPPSARRTSSAEAGVRWQPLSGPLLLVAVERWDRIDDRLRAAGAVGPAPATDAVRETRSPQLGARLALAGGVELRGNWSRAERVPDFLEFFGDQGGVSGNPALRPERVESRDAGVAWSGRLPGGVRGSLEWARFASSGDDFIVYMKHSQTAVRAQNIARAEIRGEELSIGLGLPFGFDASGATTWQSALDDGDVRFWRGRRLPLRPERESHARLAWRGHGLEASVETHYASDSYHDRSNHQRVPSRTLVDAALGWRPFAGSFRFTLEGRNLGDRRVSDVTGYPLPGRSLVASIDWRAGR